MEYVENRHFISSEDDLLQEVLFLTTDYDRTEKSLQYYYYGLRGIEDINLHHELDHSE